FGVRMCRGICPPSKPIRTVLRALVPLVPRPAVLPLDASPRPTRVFAVLAPGAGRRWCILSTCGRDSASGLALAADLAAGAFLAGALVSAFGSAFAAVAFAVAALGAASATAAFGAAALGAAFAAAAFGAAALGAAFAAAAFGAASFLGAALAAAALGAAAFAAGFFSTGFF